jgi:hypothetical protein
MIWLEPLIEVETPQGRIGYGPVRPGDVAGLLEAGLLQGADHALRIGRPEHHPFLAAQTRLTFARCGVVDPLSIADYRAHGGMRSLDRARELGLPPRLRRLPNRACAGAAGQGSRPASSGRRCARPAMVRNTSSATPMRATAALSPTHGDRQSRPARCWREPENAASTGCAR